VVRGSDCSDCSGFELFGNGLFEDLIRELLDLIHEGGQGLARIPNFFQNQDNQGANKGWRGFAIRAPA
jgi:hypothetical protein